jgi:hypothetical protein
MTATITDINEYRAWKRVKIAWQSANPSGRWEDLSEDERLRWKQMFGGWGHPSKGGD